MNEQLKASELEREREKERERVEVKHYELQAFKMC